MTTEEKIENRRDKKNNLIYPIIVGLITALVSCFFTAHFDATVRYHDYIGYNSIAKFIESGFVNAGMVDESILDLETPEEQLEMLSSVMLEQKNALNTANGKIAELSENLDSLTQANAELSAQPSVSFSSPALVIKGEELETTLQNYVVTIDGKNYYLETLLNTYILDDEISLKDDNLRYAASATERMKITDTVIHDNNNFTVVEETSDYMIGSDICTFGLISGGNTSNSIFIECGGEYSTLVFNLGHINNSDAGSRDLRILYLDSDGEYRETYSYKLNESMPYLKEVSCQIYNTQTVKITVEGPYINVNDQYGLTNMYLVK